MLADATLEDARVELRRIGRGLRRPVRAAIARAIKAGDLTGALPALAHYRGEHPDDANDIARYLADHAPVLFAAFGDTLTSADTKELRVGSKKLVVEIAAGAVIALGSIVTAAFVGGGSPQKPQPAITTPLCAGEIETTMASGERARVPSLKRCAARDAAIEIAPTPALPDPQRETIEAAISTGIPACDQLARAVSALFSCTVPGARQAWREWALAVETLVQSDKVHARAKGGACDKALADLARRYPGCAAEQP